jgi:large subunit ribosomal protein L24
LQATLLGLSVAIILALVAALVGPHFVDWSQYRATFEAQATKRAGMPVRISGPIDARILPTPTLTLQQVEIGSAAQPLARARELHVELALGSLVRGEIRASELRVTGPEISLVLAAGGRLDWPATRLGFEADQLLIEKVAIEEGRISFADRASGTGVDLRGFWFKGDLRSLIGPAKGEGGFTSAGERYAYRLATSRAGDDGMRVKIGLDPSNHPLAVEAEGALRLEDNSPRFEGTLTLARPAAMARAGGRGAAMVPWRATAKLTAAPAQALFEQLEYQYGPDERAVRLAGTAELRFGKNPRFDGVLSARQIDLDRALALPEAAGRLPLAALKALVETFTASYRPQIPVRLGIGIDAVTLAAGTLQSVRGDLKLDGDDWDIEMLEFRAPGFAQVRLSGRVGQTADGVTFKGPAQIEASNPRALVAWLEGRPDAAQGQAGMLRASGELTAGAQEFAVDRLKFEFDRRTVDGRIAYAAASGARPPRLDAELKAAELDVDGVLAFGRAAFDGTAIERPRIVSLAVDVGRANLAGIDVKGISGTFKLDPQGLTFDRVRIADLADAAFNLNGRMEGALDKPRGTVTFDVDARGLDGTVAVLAKYFPQIAGPLRQVAPKITPLKTQVTLGIEPVSSTDPGGNSKLRLALDGSAGPLRLKIGAEAAGDVGSLNFPEFRLDGQVGATDGTALIALLGLDRAINVDKRAGALNVTVRSAAGSDARLDARLAAGGLAASASGTAHLFSARALAGALDVTLQAADASPLRRGAAARATALLPVALRVKLNASANEIALENLAGNVGGSPVRGKLKLTLGQPRRIEGQVDADAADVMALLAMAAGMPRPRGDAPLWTGDPFGESVLGDLEGRVDFTASRAVLAPALSGRQVRGSVRLSAGEVAIEDVDGTLAGGRASARLVLRRSVDGLEARGRFALIGADAATLLPSDGRPVINGRLGLEAEVEGNGLSAASLIGSLKGAGAVTLEDAQISGLDPKAFNAAIRAADQGLAADAAKFRDIVATVLDGGHLAIPRLDAPIAVNAGQARISQTIAYGQGADLSFAAGADLAENSVDARLTLSGPVITDGSSTTRPEILVTLRGPLTTPRRTIDVSTMSGWLMLRAVERQAKQLDKIEAERREAERREAERREAERREAEKRETERREAEARAASVPAALPAPIILDETLPGQPRQVRPRPAAPQLRPPPAADRAPVLPPPLNIGPAPGASGKSGQAPRPAGEAAVRGAPPPSAVPPPASRSALEALFGVQR